MPSPPGQSPWRAFSALYLPDAPEGSFHGVFQRVTADPAHDQALALEGVIFARPQGQGDGLRSRGVGAIRRGHAHRHPQHRRVARVQDQVVAHQNRPAALHAVEAHHHPGNFPAVDIEQAIRAGRRPHDADIHHGAADIGRQGRAIRRHQRSLAAVIGAAGRQGQQRARRAQDPYRDAHHRLAPCLPAPCRRQRNVGKETAERPWRS
ncbi:hypothetical protein FHP25_40175 [Vineibacter terrae]|uniref:Uncharacterized protein n=1 Tax=Vineibacter terrae TaxID=2586908 RepID=A0A5C8P5Y3_9HYPH|nr:hypothetical protein FHP25_40175 [Vineibacter terrae]